MPAFLASPLLKLAIVLAIFAGGFVTGCQVESDHRDAQLLAQERALHEAFVKRAGELRGNADAVSADLAKAKQARRADRQSFEQRLSEAKRGNQLVQVECPAAGGVVAAAPGAVNLNVGVWNAALTIGRGSGGDPGGADGGAGGTGFAPVEDAFTNLGENGERWAECRRQVIGWQELARRNGWVK
jgi:hypothetical protein